MELYTCNCDKSGNPEKYEYCWDYDSYYCDNCDIWVEPECPCGDEENCGFKGRPETPNEWIIGRVGF